MTYRDDLGVHDLAGGGEGKDEATGAAAAGADEEDAGGVAVREEGETGGLPAELGPVPGLPALRLHLPAPVTAAAPAWPAPTACSAP